MVKILCFGTSLTSGYLDGGLNHWPYGIALQKCLNFQVTVSGHDGGTCIHTPEEFHLPTEFRQVLDTCQWDEVIVLVGTNDVAREYSADQIFAAWQPCLEYAHYVKDVNLWVVGLPQKGSETKVRRQFNELLDDWCDQRDQTYVPFPDKLLKPLWDSDGIHLSRQGSDALGRHLGKLVTEAVQSIH